MKRFRLQADERDAGMTLTELLIVMMVFSILLTACVAIYAGSLRSSTSTQARLEEVNDGRIAVSAMGRSLRTAILPSQLPDTTSTDTAAFIEATPFSIRFFANIDNSGNNVGASKVTYSVTGGVLTETVQAPDARPPGVTALTYCTPGPGCPVKTRILARGVVVTGDPIFRYYDELGIQLAGASLTQSQMEDVDSMDIALTNKKSRSTGDGSTYVLRVALPNHDAIIRSEES
jgi:prepilin-type N-terminal cleavage/methylation domain-containing protein